MKNRFILALYALFLCSTMGWGQSWNLSATMTATLEEGVLTISTTKEGGEAMPDYAFPNSFAPWYNDRELIIEVVINSGVTHIGNCTFYYSANLTSVTIPESVTSMGSYVFMSCIKITDVTVEWAVPLTINEGYFYYASAITLHVPEGTKERYQAAEGWKTFGTIVDDGAPVDLTLTWNLTAATTAILDNCVLTISSTKKDGEAMPDFGPNYPPWYCFRGSVNNVIIGSGITSIGNSAFTGCTNLTSMTIPGNVTSIGNGAFSGSGLTSVTIPEGVTYIGVGAFSSCNDLTSVTIPESIISIGNGAFQLCSGLSSINILEGITSIGASAFSGCNDLISVMIPNSVISIGLRAFHSCRSLTAISVEAGNMVYSSDAEGVLYNKDKTILYKCPEGKKGNFSVPASVISFGESAFENCSGLTSVTIPEGITSIGKWAFTYCTGLTSISIPESVTSIGYFAFFHCEDLTSVSIPGVVSIDSAAFASCFSLASITIPESVTSIGWRAFEYCIGLKNVTVEWAIPLSVGEYTFNSVTATLHVPAGTKALYQADPVWGSFKTIIDDGAPVIVAVTGVSLDKSTATLYVGDSERLTATVSPSDATNKDVTWSSSDAAIASVSTSGLVIAKSAGTAIITVTSVDGGFTAMCNVEVLKQDVEVEEETEVGEDGKGKIVLSLTIPSDALFSGTFKLTLPNGVQLDLSVTKLSDNLASQLTLTIVQQADGSWIFTISSSDLRSFTEMIYSRIVEIGYTIDETVTGGKHEAFISDLLLEFDNGASIDIDELPVTITVNAPTDIPDLLVGSFAHVVSSRLYIDSPVAETVQVYSISGVLLQSFQKPAGKASYPINQLKGTILIVKGGSGWVKKVIDN